MRQIRVGDVFTEAELSEAIDLVERNAIPIDQLMERVVTDEVMARINASTGQENDRRYMAYALENAVKTVARYHRRNS